MKFFRSIFVSSAFLGGAVQPGRRLVGNQLHMEEPEMIPFSRYVINCFHGTPAKPKLPGQNTEHCEQTVNAWLGLRGGASVRHRMRSQKKKEELPFSINLRVTANEPVVPYFPIWDSFFPRQHF